MNIEEYIESNDKQLVRIGIQLSKKNNLLRQQSFAHRIYSNVFDKGNFSGWDNESKMWGLILLHLNELGNNDLLGPTTTYDITCYYGRKGIFS